MKRKVWSILLVITVLAALFAGCKGTVSTSTSSSSTSTSSVSSTSSKESEPEVVANINLFGWEVPEETLKFGALIARGMYSPNEGDAAGLQNNLDHYRDVFNVDIDMQMVTGDGLEALNLALASGEYPEVINQINRDYTKKFVEQGRVVELTPYMDNIASDVKKAIGKAYPFLLDDDDKLWSFPILVGALYELPDYSAHIRFDEWTAIGSPEIITSDDYYNALNAILEKFPTTPAGETRYALSLYGPMDMPALYGGYFGLRQGYDVKDDGSFEFWGFTDKGKEMAKFFNRFHRDGTLDPDAFVNKFADWRAKTVAERVVGAMGAYWIGSNAGYEVWKETDPSTPDEKRFIQVGFKGPGAEHAYITGKSEVPSGYTIVTDKAKNPEDIIKFINFQATEPGRMLVGWGIPNGVPVGETGRQTQAWTLREDGSWEITPEAKQQLIDEEWNYQDNAHARNGPRLFADNKRWEDGVHCIWLNQMWYSENKWRQILVNNLKGTIYNATSLTVFDITEEIATLRTAVADASNMAWPLLVLADTDQEFEAAWVALQASLESAGTHRLEEILAENYKKNVEKTGISATIIN